MPGHDEYSRERLKALRLDDLDSHLAMLEKNLTQMNVQEEALRLQLNERVGAKICTLRPDRWNFGDWIQFRGAVDSAPLQ